MKCYTIKKGKHSSGFHVGLTFRKKIVFDAMFDKSCLYDLGNNNNYDVNKLFGMATAFSHHKQSGRVGWRCLDGENIEVVTYSYHNGKRELAELDVLGTVKPNTIFTCSIYDAEDEYVYTFKNINTQSYKIDKKQKDWFLFHYYLFPYFGGDQPAPHEMKILLDVY